MKTDTLITEPCLPCGDGATLTFTPPAGANVAVPSVVFIHCSDPDADIFYTLDGSEPTANSTPYGGKLLLTEGDELRAIAIHGECVGEIFDADYEIVTFDEGGLTFGFICDGPLDKVGVFDEFDPNGVENDYHWRIGFGLGVDWTLRGIEIYETDQDGVWVSGQAWATANPIYPVEMDPDPFAVYPLVLFNGTTQQNTSYADNLGIAFNAGDAVSLDAYGQPFVPLVGYFRIVFTYQPDGGEPITIQRVISHECSICEPCDDVDCVPMEFVTDVSSFGPLTTNPVGEADVGFKFTLNETVTITALGRWIVDGNSQTHTLRVTEFNGVAFVTIASVDLDASGKTAGAFAYANLATPLVLEAGDYWITSEEHEDGDQFYRGNAGAGETTVTTSSIGSVLGSDFGFTTFLAEAGLTHGPVSFKYCVGGELNGDSLVFDDNIIGDNEAFTFQSTSLVSMLWRQLEQISVDGALSGADFIVQNCPALASASFPVLTDLWRCLIEINNADVLTTLEFPVLETLHPDAEFVIRGHAILPDLDLSALTTIEEATLNIRSNTLLESINLSGLVTVGGGGASDIIIHSNPALDTIPMGDFTVADGSTIDLHGNALPQSVVEHILARCVASAAFLNGALDLSGGSNFGEAGLSVQGAADLATLEARVGLTVTLNA